MEQVVKAGHALSSRESYLGLQDALRKIRYHEGTRQPGAWAGACVVMEVEIGVAVLVSQEKWDKMKEICNHWLWILRAGGSALDYKRLQSNRGFMVYVTQAYLSFKPYLKGFHLSLETWQEGQDSDGWKVGGTLEKNKDQATQGKPQASEDEEESQEAFENQEVAGVTDEFKLRDLIGSLASNTSSRSGPPSGVTVAMPRFQQDLKALLLLAQSERPILCCMQSNKCGLTAFYGFGNASSSGFGL